MRRDRRSDIQEDRKIGIPDLVSRILLRSPGHLDILRDSFQGLQHSPILLGRSCDTEVRLAIRLVLWLEGEDQRHAAAHGCFLSILKPIDGC